MESPKKPDMRDLFGPWVHVSIEPPRRSAFRAVDVLMFASSGFVSGLAISNLIHVLTGQRATIVVSILIVLMAVLQVAYFTVEQRRIKAMGDEIAASAKRVDEMLKQDTPPEAAEGSRRVQ